VKFILIRAPSYLITSLKNKELLPCSVSSQNQPPHEKRGPYNDLATLTYPHSYEAWTWKCRKSPKRLYLSATLSSTNLTQTSCNEPKPSLCTNWRNSTYNISFPLIFKRWTGSSVGIVTDYGLDGRGSALGPTKPPVRWVTGLSRG
jgi:hypothetical protein